MTSHADTGIYYPVEDVLYQIGGHEEDREEHGGTYDHGVVVDLDRAHELLADAGNGEDGLDDQGPREQGGGEGHDDGYERDHGVPQHMPGDDRDLAQALGPGQGHVVLAKNLQHLGSGEGRHDGGDFYGEYDRGQYGVPPALEEGRGEESQLEREPVLRQRREHEVGNGDAKHGQERCPAVRKAVVPDGADDAEQQTPYHPQDHRLSAQESGDRQPLQDDLHDGLTTVLVGVPEVSLHQIAHVPGVLHQQGVVQTILGLDLRPRLGRELLVVERRAGQELHKEPGRRGDNQQDDEGVDEALERIFKHYSSPCRDARRTREGPAPEAYADPSRHEPSPWASCSPTSPLCSHT